LFFFAFRPGLGFEQEQFRLSGLSLFGFELDWKQIAISCWLRL
jgi:hypothetical protein